MGEIFSKQKFLLFTTLLLDKVSGEFLEKNACIMYFF